MCLNKNVPLHHRAIPLNWDQNSVNTRRLLLKTFENSNAMDSPMVHCSNFPMLPLCCTHGDVSVGE